MGPLYFAHDWILDTDRVTKLRSILEDLVGACDRLGVHLIPLSGKTDEGYSYARFLIEVPSIEALNEFLIVARRWNFNDWKEVPDEGDTALFKGPHYETIAYWIRPENWDSSLGMPDGLWEQARTNERIRESLNNQGHANHQ